MFLKDVYINIKPIKNRECIEFGDGILLIPMELYYEYYG